MSEKLRAAWRRYCQENHAPKETFNPARTANVVRDDGDFVVI